MFRVTPAEMRVLGACQQLGTGNPLALSRLLFCSPSTVERHLENLRKKFKVRDTVGVILAAYEWGLLQTREDGPISVLGDFN